VHEMGITQGILDSSFEAARNAGATQITEIHVSVGELTEVVEFALQFAFEALTPGTMAEGATLVVKHVSAESHCNTCDSDFEHDRYTMTCPACESLDVTLLHGRELQIDSIEAEDEVDEPAPAGSQNQE